MPKNIVILSDGVGQQGGQGHDSNVYKLNRILEDRTDNQVVYYDKGLGTDSKRIASGMAFGAAFEKNLLDCYGFIFDNYTVGDKIFLFGFSRGAALVGKLAGLINYFGILSKSDSSWILQAFRLYNNEALRGDFHEKASKFTNAHPNIRVEIEFLGVWETLPALGLNLFPVLKSLVNRVPVWKARLQDVKQYVSVRNAYHALSIDDDRDWFRPLIWNVEGKIKQVWFSGSHTDVGGGFAEAGLSDITLEWMIKSAVSHGLRLNPSSRKYWNFCIAPDATDILHAPRVGLGKIYKLGNRDKVWDKKAVEAFGPPLIHETVLMRAKQDAGYRPWILKNYGDYPDPEKWLVESRERFLRSRYNTELEDRYREFCMDMWISGKQNLPDFKLWLVACPLSYDEWSMKNQIIEQEWLWKNDASVEEFQGRRFLVERDEKTIWRDYDKDTIQEKLNIISFDPDAYDNLLKRGMKRVEYDRNRWAK